MKLFLISVMQNINKVQRNWKVLPVAMNLHCFKPNLKCSVLHFQQSIFSFRFLCEMWPRHVFSRISFTFGNTGAHLERNFNSVFKTWRMACATEICSLFQRKSWWPLGWNSKSGARYDQNEFQSCWGLQLSSLFALLLYSIVFPVQVITPHSLRLTRHNAITVNILGKMPLIFKRCLLVLLAIPQTYLNQNEA